MAEERVNVRVHFETVEALEYFIDEAKVPFLGMKILNCGGTPGQGLNSMWLDVLMTTENSNKKRFYMTETNVEKKSKSFRLTFTPQEMRILEARAARVDMDIKRFIKQSALRKRIGGYRLQPLTQHILAIDEIVKEIRKLAHEPHVERWLYEKELESIDIKVEELIAIEKDIQERLRRRIS